MLAALVVAIGLLGGFVITTRATHAAASVSACAGDTGTKALTGSIGGAAYKIEVPASWNGTLFLYSHGYVFPGQPNPATDVGDPLTGAAMLSQGYALAGSSYSQQGWALQQAFHDQIALLNFFDSTCGHPNRTIAGATPWVASLPLDSPNSFPSALRLRCLCAAWLPAAWVHGTRHWTSPSRLTSCWQAIRFPSSIWTN